MDNRKLVFHYCSVLFHQANCASELVVTDYLPSELDDRELLMAFIVPSKHLTPLGEREHRACRAILMSYRPHTVQRVTFWHLCEPERHRAHCPTNERSRVRINKPELGEGQIAVRIHLPKSALTWVDDDFSKGIGHYEINGALFGAPLAWAGWQNEVTNEEQLCISK
jgi:hypothetical protein